MFFQLGVIYYKEKNCIMQLYIVHHKLHMHPIDAIGNSVCQDPGGEL